MRPVTTTLRERFGLDLQDIAGASVAAEIPIGDDAVNRVIATHLANHPQLESVRVQGLDNDTLAVLVAPRARLVPPMQIVARIEAQPDFPGRPVLTLRWTMPAIGPLALLVAPALAFFKRLPPGIAADGDRLAVDLRVLLESRGLGELVGFIRRAAVHTRPGGFVLRLDAGVSSSVGGSR